MDDKFNLLIHSFGQDRFKRDEPIKYHARLGVGGNAKLFTIVFTTRELIRLISTCRELRIPFYLMGLGSRVTISETGFDGVVVKNRTRNIQTISVKGKVTRVGIGVEEAYVEADSGLSMAKVSEYLLTQKLATAGFQDVNGTVGGNIFVNKFLQSQVKSIKVLTQDDDIENIEADSLSLKDHIVLSVIFKIKAQRT